MYVSSCSFLFSNVIKWLFSTFIAQSFLDPSSYRPWWLSSFIFFNLNSISLVLLLLIDPTVVLFKALSTMFVTKHFLMTYILHICFSQIILFLIVQCLFCMQAETSFSAYLFTTDFLLCYLNNYNFCIMSLLRMRPSFIFILTVFNIFYFVASSNILKHFASYSLASKFFSLILTNFFNLIQKGAKEIFEKTILLLNKY